MKSYKNKCKSLIASTVLASLATTAFASDIEPLSDVRTVNLNHFERGADSFTNGTSPSQVVPFIEPVKSVKAHKHFSKTVTYSAKASKSSASASGDDTPTPGEAALLSGQELVDYIVNADVGAMFGAGFFDETADTTALYTEENILTLINAITARAPDYSASDRQGVWGLFYVARAAEYVAFYSDGRITFSDAVKTAADAALTAFFANNNVFTDTNNDHGNVLYDAIAFMDSHMLSKNYIPELLALMDTYPQVEGEGSYEFLNALYIIHFTFYRQSTEADFQAAMQAQENLVPHFKGLVDRLAFLQTWGNGDNFEDGAFATYHVNAISELARLMEYSNHFAAAEAATADILDEYTRLSAPWFKAVTSLIYYSDCSKFEGICRDDLETELYGILFPNTFSFDDGKFVVRTAISEEEAQELYHASKQVEAQYKRAKQDLEAVENDPNETLTMFIYGTHSDYLDFHNFLFGLDTNNGGIYIEQWGQFFTYQRTEQESIYSLEELFRHEYVHYLNSRFTIDGMWGEVDFYNNERLTWWDEGSAEFFAGATQTDGVKVRKTMVREIVHDGTDRFTVSDVLSSSYSTGFKFYRYSALFFNYLNANQPETITQLYKLGKAGDISGFDTLVAQLSADATLQANYDAFLDTQVANYGTMSDFTSINVPELSLLTANNAEDIQAVLETQLAGTSCDIAATTMNHRFVCTGTISGDLDGTLDTAIEELATNQVNNFETMNCAYGVVTNGSTTYSCEGALRNIGVDLPDNTAPIADAGDDQEAFEGDIVTFYGGDSYDPDGDAITYSWEQISGSTVIGLEGADTASATFTLADTTSNETVTFELTVTDGEFSDKDTVTINVSAANQAPIADAGDDITTNEGSQEILDATRSTDPEGQMLSYLWEHVSGPELSLDNAEIATPSFTAPQVSGDQESVYQVTVGDGDLIDTDTVVITIVDTDPSNTAPVADAGTNRSVNEGATVNLSGTASDADGDALTITWSQTGGTSVTLTGADTLTPSFTAPEVTANTTLTFELSVTDGEATTTDTVTITVNNTTTNNGGGPTGDAGNKSSGGGSMGIFSGLGLLLLAFRRKACIR